MKAKRLFALSLMLALLVFSLTVPAAALAFTDVPDDSYYADAVAWAVDQGITTGTSGTTFSPTQDCTKAQIITFIWRSQGSPSASISNPYSDLSGSEYYATAATWAYEQGMTDGTVFSGSTPCTRSMAVEYIWKNAGSPAGSETSFTDVSASSSYATAVAWAVQQGITDGTSSTTFSPNTVCSRAQIVTFLKRYDDSDDSSNSQQSEVAVSVSGISLNKASISLNVGDTATLTATVLPDNATYKSVVWSSSDDSVASVTSNGVVTAKNAGSAIITATADNKRATCTVEIVAAASISYSGTGDTTISGVNIPAGSYYAEYTHNGSRNFITHLYYGEKSYDRFSISNEIGRCSGQVALYSNGNKAVSDGILEVKADGDWTIVFKPVSGTSTTNIKGNGQIVTGIFTASSSRTIVTTTHDGESNFIVKIIKYNGTNSYDYESVSNEIGSYSGQVVVNLTKGEKYFIYVRADGNWTVDLCMGDAVTTYTPPTVPSGSDNSGTQDSAGGSSENEGGNSEKKWSSDDAIQLSKSLRTASEQIQTATGYCTSALKIPAMKTLYYSSAVSNSKVARTYLSEAMRLMESRVSLTTTDGETLLSKVQEVDALLDKIDDLTITSDTVDDYSSTIQTNCVSAQVKMVGVLKLVSDLLSAFL
jgi:hypothetical protein